MATSTVKPKAMIQDNTRCIGCRACMVACKSWNERPEDHTDFFAGEGYQNPRDLDANGGATRAVSVIGGSGVTPIVGADKTTARAFDTHETSGAITAASRRSGCGSPARCGPVSAPGA